MSLQTLNPNFVEKYQRLREEAKLKHKTTLENIRLEHRKAYERNWDEVGSQYHDYVDGAGDMVMKIFGSASDVLTDVCYLLTNTVLAGANVVGFLYKGTELSARGIGSDLRYIRNRISARSTLKDNIAYAREEVLKDVNRMHKKLDKEMDEIREKLKKEMNEKKKESLSQKEREIIYLKKKEKYDLFEQEEKIKDFPEHLITKMKKLTSS